MPYIVNQYPGKGLYPEMQGCIYASYAAHKTSAYARGGSTAATSLTYPLSGGTLYSYNSWCTNLAAAGCKMVHLNWSGFHWAWGEAPMYNFEPSPHGTYNVWHSALDDSSLATYRSHQVSGSPGDGTFPQAYWDDSNIKALLDACDEHGIEIFLEFANFKEFTTGWTYHPWNYNNYYIERDSSGNLRRCEVADRGFLSNPWEIFTDPDALTAFKARIKFIIDLIGDRDCITLWGICEESIWLCGPKFWGYEGYDPDIIDDIRNYVTPWHEDVAEYIRAQDSYNRPICASVVPPRPDFSWPADANHFDNVRLEPLTAYPIDYVGTNCYLGDYDQFIDHLNAVRDKVSPKPILIHQYYPEPWTTSPDAPLREEYAPYEDSKRVEWLGAVLKWGIGPGRWQGLVESSHNVWSVGGYADPNWYSFGAVTATFRANNDWKTWSGAQDWADDVSSTGLSKILCTGDGDHFAGVLIWTSGGAKSVTISSVTDGAWTFYVFDWTDGGLETTLTPTAASNSLTISVTPGSEYQAIVLGSKD